MECAKVLEETGSFCWSVKCAKVLEETGEFLLEGEHCFEDRDLGGMWEKVLAMGVREVLEEQEQVKEEKSTVWDGGRRSGFGEGWSVLEAGLPVWDNRREIMDEGGELFKKVLWSLEEGRFGERVQIFGSMWKAFGEWCLRFGERISSFLGKKESKLLRMVIYLGKRKERFSDGWLASSW